MSTITTINATDLITDSRAVINTNFSNLNTDKIETSTLDTDTTLAANSDAKIPSQKAVKAYVDAGGNVNASTTNKGIVEEATQAEVDAGTAAGATGARLFVNPSTTTTKFSTTQVFSGSAPNNTFTDLDLSSVVGAKQRVVILKVTCSTAGGQIYTFKRNGDAGTYPYTSAGSFNQTNAGLQNGESAYVMVTTDTAGVVEWTAYAATPTTTINVEAYW